MNKHVLRAVCPGRPPTILLFGQEEGKKVSTLFLLTLVNSVSKKHYCCSLVNSFFVNLSSRFHLTAFAKKQAARQSTKLFECVYGIVVS